MLRDGRTRRVTVLRALQLGDLLCAVPGLRALRAAVPEAHVALIGLPWAVEFVERYPAYLDELIEFPGYPGIPERPAPVETAEPFFAAMAARGWDLAIQLQGDGTITNEFVGRLGAARTAGFSTESARGADADWFLPYPDGLPEPRRHLALMGHLGAPADAVADDRPEIPIHDEDRRRAAELLEPVAERLYAAVHPGARDERRRWPVERFAAVADALAARGVAPVLTGSADDGEVVERVARAMSAPALTLTGRTDLGAIAALVEGARLVVSNDTGVSHLAAATRTPSVVIFRASDPRRWAPLDRRRHLALCPAMGPECWWDSSCSHEGRHPGALVEVTTVLDAVDRQLALRRA